MREWNLGLHAGPPPVSRDGSAGALRFAWMTQRKPDFGSPIDDVDRIAAALGVRDADITSTGLPIQQVSCGVPYVIVPMTTRAAVDSATPDVRLLDFEAYVFTTDRDGASDDAVTYSRMFAPQLGVFEDPATGSASGPLGAYLVRHRRVEPDRAGSILNLQGVKLGRPSWIHISVDAAGGDISRVRVGGTAVFVAEGLMDVEN
jgi:trans-2,3-dihydro-3-hydroxyanthranilate isomerase